MGEQDAHFLKQAARLALRGHGGAEPNPLVGCVIVSPENTVVGWGYHRQCGGPHAEIVALQRAGNRARGSTLYCTLEPCNHVGRTGPCSQAVIQAGVARVVIARREPWSTAAGGLERIAATGIQTHVIDSCQPAIDVSEPFVHRLTTGLPWVIAKWAQTIDGKIATRSGESQWISNQASRKMVHRERGRVDAILTGVGTVKCDDPMLTARSGKPRRVARRIIIDPYLDISHEAKLVKTARSIPTVIVCNKDMPRRRPDQVSALLESGVELMGAGMPSEEMFMDEVLRALVERYEIATVLTECGPGLLRSLLQNDLVNEAWVFIAPRLLGDDEAIGAVSGMTTCSLSDGLSMELRSVRRRGSDLIAHYRINQ